MADMSKEAIRVRWAQHQRRSAGGWIKVPGQSDPVQDVEALLGMLDAKPAPTPAPKVRTRPPRKRRARATVTSTDTRTPDE